jgi:hypothetical protein
MVLLTTDNTHDIHLFKTKMCFEIFKKNSYLKGIQLTIGLPIPMSRSCLIIRVSKIGFKSDELICQRLILLIIQF